METLKVKPWGKEQGDYVVINKEDFNPEFHELLEDAKAGSAGDKNAEREKLKEELNKRGIQFNGRAGLDALQGLLDQDDAAMAKTEVEALQTELVALSVSFEGTATKEQLLQLLEDARAGK